MVHENEHDNMKLKSFFFEIRNYKMIGLLLIYKNTCEISFMLNVLPVREHKYSNRTSFQYERYEIKPRSDNGFSGEPIFPSTRVNR